MRETTDMLDAPKRFERAAPPPVGEAVRNLREERSNAVDVAATLRVSEVADADAFRALRAEWTELLERSRAGVFNAWEWLYPWHQRIGKDRALRILLARDGAGTLVGLMALGLEVRKVAGRRVRRLAFLGETHVGSDYLDIIAVEGREEELARVFADALLERRAQWDVLDLHDLPSDSVTLKVFSERFGLRRFVAKKSDRYICPYETFAVGAERESFDAFLKRTGRRDNFLRRRKWLEKQPGFSVERAVTPESLERPMTDFFRLHASRWAVDGGSQGIKGPTVEAFHRDATKLLAERGLLRLYTLRLQDQALASVYGIVHRGKFIYFQSGYDPAWRNKSVGLVLVGLTFQDALEAGLTEYDFLRGTETYKSDWVTQQRTTSALRVYAPWSAGAWLDGAEHLARVGRNVVKRVLPASLTEQVRRWRRRRAAI
jgi:CelD/BcsL family acetyltransferase involved in cellulose biosynthesis